MRNFVVDSFVDSILIHRFVSSVHRIQRGTATVHGSGNDLNNGGSPAHHDRASTGAAHHRHLLLLLCDESYANASTTASAPSRSVAYVRTRVRLDGTASVASSGDSYDAACVWSATAATTTAVRPQSTRLAALDGLGEQSTAAAVAPEPTSLARCTANGVPARQWRHHLPTDPTPDYDGQCVQQLIDWHAGPVPTPSAVSDAAAADGEQQHDSARPEAEDDGRGKREC